MKKFSPGGTTLSGGRDKLQIENHVICVRAAAFTSLQVFPSRMASQTGLLIVHFYSVSFSCRRAHGQRMLSSVMEVLVLCFRISIAYTLRREVAMIKNAVTTSEML